MNGVMDSLYANVASHLILHTVTAHYNNICLTVVSAGVNIPCGSLMALSYRAHLNRSISMLGRNIAPVKLSNYQFK